MAGLGEMAASQHVGVVKTHCPCNIIGNLAFLLITSKRYDYLTVSGFFGDLIKEFLDPCFPTRTIKPKLESSNFLLPCEIRDKCLF